MARENQSLQVGMIVLAFLCVVLLIIAYFLYANGDTHYQNLVKAKASASSAEESSRNSLATSNRLKVIMGFTESDNIDTIEKSYEEDMKAYANNTPPEQASYRNVLKLVHIGRKESTQNEEVAKSNLDVMTQNLLNAEARYKSQLDKFNEGMNELRESYALERNKFDTARKKFESIQIDLEKTVDSQRVKYEGLLAEKARLGEELEAKMVKVQRAVDRLLDEQKKSNHSFEVTDGTITWVNQRNNTVWVDLGSADALRRQVTFSIIDVDAPDAGRAKAKGSIEIVRILGDHLAEARITSDSFKNPILPGDKIYSQVWHRGRKLRFAFTGLLDIDGDQTHDVDLLRELVELNGGAVDSYVTKNGVLQGELTVATRFLVLGVDPKEQSKAKKYHKLYHDMGREAHNLGIETITLAQFLDQMGYHPQEKTIPLGDGARASDFIKTKKPTRPSSSLPAHHFRKRTPTRSVRLPF